MAERKPKKKGVSTRVKNIHLPMYVYDFDIPQSKTKFRVCRKVGGAVITYGYFHKIHEAERLARRILRGNKKAA